MVRDKQSVTKEAARKAPPHQAEEQVGPDPASPEATVASPATPPSLGRQASLCSMWTDGRKAPPGQDLVGFIHIAGIQ